MSLRSKESMRRELTTQAVRIQTLERETRNLRDRIVEAAAHNGELMTERRHLREQLEGAEKELAYIREARVKGHGDLLRRAEEAERELVVARRDLEAARKQRNDATQMRINTENWAHALQQDKARLETVIENLRRNLGLVEQDLRAMRTERDNAAQGLANAETINDHLRRRIDELASGQNLAQLDNEIVRLKGLLEQRDARINALEITSKTPHDPGAIASNDLNRIHHALFAKEPRPVRHEDAIKKITDGIYDLRLKAAALEDARKDIKFYQNEVNDLMDKRNNLETKLSVSELERRRLLVWAYSHLTNDPDPRNGPNACAQAVSHLSNTDLRRGMLAAFRRIRSMSPEGLSGREIHLQNELSKAEKTIAQLSDKLASYAAWRKNMTAALAEKQQECDGLRQTCTKYERKAEEAQAKLDQMGSALLHLESIYHLIFGEDVDPKSPREMRNRISNQILSLFTDRAELQSYKGERPGPNNYIEEIKGRAEKAEKELDKLGRDWIRIAHAVFGEELPENLITDHIVSAIVAGRETMQRTVGNYEALAENYKQRLEKAEAGRRALQAEVADLNSSLYEVQNADDLGKQLYDLRVNYTNLERRSGAAISAMKLSNQELRDEIKRLRGILTRVGNCVGAECSLIQARTRLADISKIIKEADNDGA